MGSRLPAFIRQRGLLTGIRMYWHFKSGSRAPIRLPFLKHPVYFRKGGDAKIFEQLFIDREYDIDVPFTPSTIIDLGANVGYASILFANRFASARIFALEPEAGNNAQAVKNTRPYPNIRMVQGAIWHEPAPINLVDKGLGEAAYMVEPGEGEHMVNAYTIPGIMQEMDTDIIDILKIDIEGAEKELFEHNFSYWLPRTRILIVETHDRYRKGTSHAVFGALSQYNFSLTLSGENLVLYNEDLR